MFTRKAGQRGALALPSFVGLASEDLVQNGRIRNFGGQGGRRRCLREDGGDVISSSCCRKTVNDVKLGESEKKGSNFLIRG